MRCSRWRLAAVVILLAVVAFTGHHLREIGVSDTWLTVTDLLAFAWVGGSLWLAHLNHTATYISRHHPGRAGVRDLSTAVVVAAYNEDPAAVAAMLDSLSAQTRLPDWVVLVDDGSTVDSEAMRRVFVAWLASLPGSTRRTIDARFVRQANAGKRHAQAHAVTLLAGQPDVLVTVDSDTVLDRYAVERGVGRFADPRVQSVAGMLYSANARTNLLTRLVDLGYVASFLNGRASWSRLGSVTVNCGGLAFYRMSALAPRLAHYTSQRVWGRAVMSGDDRMLTGYAVQAGRTVLAEDAIGWTLQPYRFSHLTRQRLRWWRSFFWGGLWLLRTTPVSKPVWWLVAWQFVSFSLFTVSLALMLAVHPLHALGWSWWLPLYLAALAYVRTVRYVLVPRPDMTLRQQMGVWALAPLASLLNGYLCTLLQYVALATVRNTGWNTRAQVEVQAVSA